MLKRMKFKSGFAGIIALLFLLTACDEDQICDENTRSFLHAGLYTVKNGIVQDSVPSEVFILSLGEISLAYDSSNISKLFFPLNPEIKSISYLIVADSVADTLQFNYHTALNFVSYPCGFAPEYTITSVEHSHNGIDSVEIIHNKVNPSDEENLHIFL